MSGRCDSPRLAPTLSLEAASQELDVSRDDILRWVKDGRIGGATVVETGQYPVFPPGDMKRLRGLAKRLVHQPASASTPDAMELPSPLNDPMSWNRSRVRRASLAAAGPSLEIVTRIHVEVGRHILGWIVEHGVRRLGPQEERAAVERLLTFLREEVDLNDLAATMTNLDALLEIVLVGEADREPGSDEEAISAHAESIGGVDGVVHDVRQPDGVGKHGEASGRGDNDSAVLPREAHRHEDSQDQVIPASDGPLQQGVGILADGELDGQSSSDEVHPDSSVPAEPAPTEAKHPWFTGSAEEWNELQRSLERAILGTNYDVVKTMAADFNTPMSQWPAAAKVEILEAAIHRGLSALHLVYAVSGLGPVDPDDPSDLDFPLLREAQWRLAAFKRAAAEEAGS